MSMEVATFFLGMFSGFWLGFAVGVVTCAVAHRCKQAWQRPGLEIRELLQRAAAALDESQQEKAEAENAYAVRDRLWQAAHRLTLGKLTALEQREQAIRALIARLMAFPSNEWRIDIARQLEAILLDEAPQTTSQERE